MSRFNFTDFLAYALTISLCANLFLTAAVICLAWLYPHANKEWIPKRLREPPKLANAGRQ